jgi:malic enzyme
VLLNRRLLTKDLAFPATEREAFGLLGLLPDRVLSIEEQMELELEHLRRKSDDLERYIGLAALQDRNATLFYRLLAEHLAEFLPVVYTPTVGRACQEFSHIVRRTRGVWITPADRDRVPRLLRGAPYVDVRLIVVTDNERILGLGDQGAGGMAISIGKLALYTAACGIHPTLTLPVSLDVGTDNPALLEDPLYVGYRAPRLRGEAYDELVEAFVDGVAAVWPGCLIQWEDFKQRNALGILERYRHRALSFNDDIQGTAAVVVGGVLAGMRQLATGWADQRIVLAGAGAAGTGIIRLLRLAMAADGLDEARIRRAIVPVDSAGLVHDARPDLDQLKREIALPADAVEAYGLRLPAGEGGSRGGEGWSAGGTGGSPGGEGWSPGLLETIRRVRPTVLVGTTGVAGTFDEPVLRALGEGTPRPIVLPLSNPTSASEATPEAVLRWTGGRALVATGSPFDAVSMDGVRHEVGQANNVFIFPGVGLAAIAAEIREVTDRMLLAAARALAGQVAQARLETGALYPPVQALRQVSRAVAMAVADEACSSGHAGIDASLVEAEVDRAMWWPAYVPYVLADRGS